MVAARKKANTLKRALKTAARLPARVSGGAGSGRDAMSPIVGEVPVVLLRVQVLGCKDLATKDKSGMVDPFVVVSFSRNRHQTPVAKKTLNPMYPAKDSTFDFPIYLSLADKLGVLELVVWNKDVLRKDYLDEAALPLEDLFKDTNALGFFHENNAPFLASLVSTRASRRASGTIQVKVGFVIPPNVNHELTFNEVYKDLMRRSQQADISIVSAPPTEGIGTVRTCDAIPAYENDGLSSDEGEQLEDDDEDREDREFFRIPLFSEPTSLELTLPSQPSSPGEKYKQADSPESEVITSPIVEPPTPIARTPSAPVSPAATPKSGKFPKMTLRRPSLNPRRMTEGSVLTTGSTASVPGLKKRKFSKAWVGKKNKREYKFNAANDILGIVMLEIQRAEDLPKLRNMTRLGWDMDPFVVCSFGKKVYRTRVIRHSLNPVWDEKLIFQVRRYEIAFKVQLTVLDWDKLSSNDHVCDAYLDVAELMKNAPQPDEKTGLYPEVLEGADAMQEFKLKLTTAKEKPWEAKHNPVLTVRARYQPYDALRQRFWRQYLKQCDTDDTGTVSRLELTSTLDSLNSTLAHETIDSFFTRHGKRPDEELTLNEAIQCLEQELCRPASEKRHVDADETGTLDTSTTATPMLVGPYEKLTPRLALDKLNFSGPAVHPSAVQPDSPPSDEPAPKAGYPTEPSQQELWRAAQPFIDSAATGVPVGYHPGSSTSTLKPHAIVIPGESPKRVPPSRQNTSTSMASSEDVEDESSGSGSGSGSSGINSDDSLERVINIKNCPLCHRPRLNNKAEMDIVTHLAICASQDWARVDRIMVGNFVTASQAQRKWYTKVISKVSSGNYKLGANSANIIVQNRMTGQLEEEKMQVYVRLGIRLLYKGAKGRMEGARARRLLKSMSIKQGMKYDSPESVRDIPAFIQFHNLLVDELLLPLSEYKTFNQFFYRKLKPGARPVESPDDPSRLVSAADSRLMAFETVSEATRLWIKGREFTVARLLGEAYRDQWDRYAGGALAIFRLAPQDYHRFHCPVDGNIGPMTYIAGEYYTVNPQAIRTALDVYGENARKIVPIDSPTFGRVMAVCIGAMMVGSIIMTVKEGQEIKRGEELGYFAFGGSTVVCLFEKGAVQWDEDLLINGRASLETLVRVGMGIGRCPRGNGHKKLVSGSSDGST